MKLTEKEYRQHPAISRSSLWLLSDSPEKFRWQMEHPEPPTPALVFGQLFHKMALQPETLQDEFAIAPVCDRRTKEGKAAFAAFEETAAGKTIVTADTVEQAQEMCKALMANDIARKLLAGEKETPFFWTDDLTGEECKCRLDVLTKMGTTDIIVDLKTTDNAETDAFMRAAIKYGYDLQSAMYSEGYKANTGKEPVFVFVAIEKKPPYAVNILQADKLVLRRGYDIFRELIGTYHYCRESGNWYGYLGRDNVINNLGLPAWLAKEVE